MKLVWQYSEPEEPESADEICRQRQQYTRIYPVEYTKSYLLEWKCLNRYTTYSTKINNRSSRDDCWLIILAIENTNHRISIYEVRVVKWQCVEETPQHPPIMLSCPYSPDWFSPLSACGESGDFSSSTRATLEGALNASVLDDGSTPLAGDISRM